MIPYLELSLRSRGARVVASIGDAPILSNPDGQQRQGRMPINWWLQPRGNCLRVHAERIDGASLAPLLAVALCFPGGGQPPLCRLGWGMPEGAEFLPLPVTLPFVPPRAPPVRLWRQARQIAQRSPPERRAAQELAAALHQAFAQRDLERVLDLLDHRFEEMALGFELDLDEHRAQARRSQTGMSGNVIAHAPLGTPSTRARPLPSSVPVRPLRSGSSTW